MARVRVEHGSEGPTHDPYGYRTVHFTTTKGLEVSIKESGLGYSQLTIGGKVEPMEFNEDAAIARFVDHTDMTPDAAAAIAERNYVEDPMGPASMYE